MHGFGAVALGVGQGVEGALALGVGQAVEAEAALCARDEAVAQEGGGKACLGETVGRGHLGELHLDAGLAA